MRRNRTAWRFGLVGIGVLFALAGISLTMPSLFGLSEWLRPRAPHVMTYPVRRTDLSVTMTTGGRVDSSDKTYISCEIENVSFSVRGNGMSLGGASTILSVIPDGSVVKKGDILCELDSSAYVELVRQQQMNVDRARADYNQAKLNHEVRLMAETEYRDGLMLQTRKSLNGQIALAQSDMERASDRLVWSRRMYEKGYLPKSQVTSEEFALNRMALNLKKNRTTLDLFERFSAPKYMFILRGDVLAAEAILNYQSRRLQRFEDQLALYKKQVERCTIRAPHDGYLVHYNEEMRNIRVEPGTVVRQNQKLFYLPDLGRMEVAALLHESIVRDIQPGMRAKVRVEALPNRLLEGHIDSITQIPTQNWFSDVKNFVGTIKLHSVPKGLMPGMSAEVEIITAHKPDVLVIPAEALAIEEGHDVCYVAHEGGLERREVKLGQVNRDLLEVTGGLEEGESVVLEPEQALAPVAIAELDEPSPRQQSHHDESEIEPVQ
ncbi:MAG: efflux RND transporter periplasmic adaptor subunit [Isosphaeraceae bacterium]